MNCYFKIKILNSTNFQFCKKIYRPTEDPDKRQAY